MIVNKKNLRIEPNNQRVMLRPFRVSKERTHLLIERVLALSEENAKSLFQSILQEFGSRHRNFVESVLINYQRIAQTMELKEVPGKQHQLLLGAYFTHEYSVESAALFNPSVVWHPQQGDVPSGSKRFLLSLRATGEGHISSIVFRTGILDPDGHVTLEEDSLYCTSPLQYREVRLTRKFLSKKIRELGLGEIGEDPLFEQLPLEFTFGELKEIMRSDLRFEGHFLLSSAIGSILSSNYEITFSEETTIDERVIFPYATREMNGMEDARFVTFVDEGKISYYATYTAYSGMVTFPQLVETEDFLTFRISTLVGKGAQNKGMALFPRRINEKYAMLGRQDGENIYLMFSDDLYFWRESTLILAPKYSWEFVQLGNCGSPIETSEGWLVLSHGVGPMRKYCIGVFLLDLHDPTKVISRLPYPILSADDQERDGYVPNVVYTCGALSYGEQLFIPYARSDSSIGFATINLGQLLKTLMAFSALGEAECPQN